VAEITDIHFKAQSLKVNGFSSHTEEGIFVVCILKIKHNLSFNQNKKPKA
jgi:hypothetical protein